MYVIKKNFKVLFTNLVYELKIKVYINNKKSKLNIILTINNPFNHFINLEKKNQSFKMCIQKNTVNFEIYRPS